MIWHWKKFGKLNIDKIVGLAPHQLLTVKMFVEENFDEAPPISSIFSFTKNCLCNILHLKALCTYMHLTCCTSKQVEALCTYMHLTCCTSKQVDYVWSHMHILFYNIIQFIVLQCTTLQSAIIICNYTYIYVVDLCLPLTYYKTLNRKLPYISFKPQLVNYY